MGGGRLAGDPDAGEAYRAPTVRAGPLLRAHWYADARDLGFEETDAEVEAVDVVGRAEPGPRSVRQPNHRRESTIELLDPGHQADGAVLGHHEVGRQRRPAHGEGPLVAAALGVAAPGSPR